MMMSNMSTLVAPGPASIALKGVSAMEVDSLSPKLTFGVVKAGR